MAIMAIISLILYKSLFVPPFLRMKQVDETDFHEIWYLTIFR